MGVLCRNPDKYRANGSRKASSPNILFTDNPDDLYNLPIDLVVEAAGQDALRMYGHQVLARGLDLLVTSIGAFTDDNFYHALAQAAASSGARMLLASGALPAVDWMAAASLAGVERVSITQSKPGRLLAVDAGRTHDRS